MPPTSLSSDRGGTDGRPHVTRRAAFLSSLPATVGFVSSARGARTRYDASRSVAGDCGVPKVGQHERRLPGSLFALESAGLARGSNRRSRDVHHITQSREFGQINLFHLGPTPRWINPGHWPRLAGAFSFGGRVSTAALIGGIFHPAKKEAAPLRRGSRHGVIAICAGKP